MFLQNITVFCATSDLCAFVAGILFYYINVSSTTRIHHLRQTVYDRPTYSHRLMRLLVFSW